MSNTIFKVNKSFKIVPAQDLKQEAHVAWEGARYHLDKLDNLINEPYFLLNKWEHDPDIDESKKLIYRTRSNSFHWHLRGFFWELFSCFETVLQYSNLKYGLLISEKDVKWKSVSKEAKNASIEKIEWNKKFLLLDATWNSPWFFEVRQYRHFSHRAFNFSQIEFREIEKNGKVNYEIELIWIMPSREGQRQYITLIKQLADYLNNMLSFLKLYFS